MPRTAALYRGGKRSAPYYTLEIEPRKKPSQRVDRSLISKGVVRTIGGLDNLSMFSAERGVLTTDGPVLFPFVRTRIPTENNASSYKVFLTENELAGLASHFVTPAEVLNHAFFVYQTMRQGQNTIMLKPNFRELFNPDWLVAYNAWRSGAGGLPTPSDFRWKIGPKKTIHLPDITSVFCHQIAQRIRTVRVVLNGESSSPRLLMHYGGELPLAFSIAMGQVHQLRSFASEEEGFDRKDFLALFGRDGIKRTYEPHKIAKKSGVGFGNVGGLPVKIKFFQGKPPEEGRMYYFRITRADNIITIEAYLDAKRKKFLGTTRLFLLQGFPSGRTDGLTLHAKEA